MSRERGYLGDLESHRFDAIVIGAGINGSAIARDMAMRGLDVLLVEKHDIGSGTTPWSTRLIHGGLRYLEHGDIGLVRESLRERETLLRIAPHLVQPLSFMLPVYEWQRRGLNTIRVGLTAYDLLSAGSQLPRHRMLSRADALTQVPSIATADLKGAAIYHDAQVTFPERLSLENVIDAAANGAQILTHACVTRIHHEGGAVTGVEIHSELDDWRIRVHASHVINAAGPWVDRLVERLNGPALIGGTKGSHIVVDRFPGAPNEALYSEAYDDGRPFFIIPWQRWLLIGTTDTQVSESPDATRPSLNEIDYLLRQANVLVPSASLARASVLLAYAGIRPLPATDTKRSGAITRRHSIKHHVPHADGLFSVVGGKLTTHRSLAEHVTNIVSRRIGRFDDCRTASQPLPGFGCVVAAAQALLSAGVGAAAISRLSEVYGARLRELADTALSDPQLLAAIGGEHESISAEIVFGVQQELAVTIADVLLRRTMLGLRPGLGVDLLEPSLDIACTHLQWDEHRRQIERQTYLKEIERLRLPT